MIKIKLELHKDGNCCLLDSQDAFKYISENTAKEVELYNYIEHVCDFLNYPFLHNNEMAYADGDKCHLAGWIAGYDAAKHHDVTNGGKLIVTGRGYCIIFPIPFMI